MKILVTGGAGYIGSVLVPMLLNAKHEVMVLDNLWYNQTSLLDCCHDKKFTFITGDVRDEKLINKITNNLDFIIPLACIVGTPACDNDPIAAKTINLDAIKMLMRIRGRGHYVIFPNTNSGYGIGQSDIYCTEESPLNPISLYARLKVEAEQLILRCGNTISLRLATVFGVSPRMRTDLLVNDLVQMAINDYPVKVYEPYAKRNYIHVRDVARAFLHCMQNFETMKDGVYNLGLSNANLSKWELCEEIKKQIPQFTFFEGEGEDPDKRNYIVSNEKIEKTGFTAQISLQEGIAELIKGFQIVRPKQFRNS
ncbi:MAG: NAD(P)-dependent oxidoreductase [bacterium]|nr:NAD(P)-dependent oxidoreductase [bacterium]